ncbi:amino acid ABC transporter substrate-binding protein [Burkholderia sp. Bp9012]|uniref:amino acid ABC transporter substrate-binding protein n=1 Tax=Burkholderia sp. Bp9012 TaxID=2184562 RepID=UPI000F5B625E|nr:amino acid ABC transporter substrate-binding protein [Burkholderia sp. Bp9012]RQR85278.1 amino acid ABC transporter substrate-binding protein [Burkholderia sp. Bp9012]
MKGLKWILGTVILATSATAIAGTTFDSVKKKGVVTCGVSTNLPGFAYLDSKGNWQGLDVDMCRAIAAAALGDAGKTKITPLTTQQRFTALQAGEVDVLTRNTTQTLSRDSTLGLVGTGVNFYDAQGLMVKKSLGVKDAKGLDGGAICVLPGTTTELNLTDWFRSHNLKFRPVVLSKYEELLRAFVAGRCDAVTADKSELATARVTLQNPEQFVILPDALSKEPLGPMVRQGDEAWFNVVRWTLNAMFEAEEYGVTSKNVDQMRKSSNPNVQRLLGVTPGLGKGLGVSDAWAYNIVKQVGNYGETFERSMGMESAVKLPRGMNALYTQGGLMYGWPIR